MVIEGFNNVNSKNSDVQSVDLAINSGQGSGTPVLDIVAKRFNWGAFLLNWIWGLGNKSFITLIIFPISIAACIPILGWVICLGCSIWFGIKGNEWAWQNKRWESVEHFHSVQKKWAIAGLICSIFLNFIIIGMIFAMTMPALISNTTQAQNRAMTLKSINTILEAALINETLDVKCNPSSEGLAACFAKRVNTINASGAILQTVDGVNWSFYGNGQCKNPEECFVTITDSNGLNETIPLTIENGYMKVHAQEIVDKYSK